MINTKLSKLEKLDGNVNVPIDKDVIQSEDEVVPLKEKPKLQHPKHPASTTREYLLFRVQVMDEN